MTNRLKLCSVSIKGFKSISAIGQTIEFGDVTVLIGSNSAGKSNLVSFFKMLNYMMTGALQTYIGEQGYANSLLHFGADNTAQIEAKLVFCDDENCRYSYLFNLVHAGGDTLIFKDEYVNVNEIKNEEIRGTSLGSGHSESKLPAWYQIGKEPKKRELFSALFKCRAYQFHDTSATSRIRNSVYVGDSDQLHINGGNLAAYLYTLENTEDWNYDYLRIVKRIQAVVPNFKGFVLKPTPLNDNMIRLDWQEKGSAYRFGPHQLSDGALRFMALTTLLLQPVEKLPKVIIIDEPELGLHPAAISALSEMIRSASQNCQIILATQSPRLLDEFNPEEVVIVEKGDDDSSTFKRLSAKELEIWKDVYNLSELWEKNIIGGRP